MIKDGLAAVGLIAMAELAFALVAWPMNLALNALQGIVPSAISTFTAIKILVLAGLLLAAYAVSAAVVTMKWKPLPRWTFWIIAVPWATRLFSLTIVLIQMAQVWIVFSKQGPYAGEFLAQVAPFAAGNFLVMAVCLIGLEIIINKMNFKFGGK